MLYLVGGTGNAERVDVADLFTNRLASHGLDVDYVIFERSNGPAWRVQEWRGARAYTIGRSNRQGLLGGITNKLRELNADLRTCWLSLSRPYDIVQIRDKFVVGLLCLIAAKLRGRKYSYWLSYPYAETRVLDAQEGRARIPWVSFVGGHAAAWLLYRIIMPRADHVFVQSQQMLEDVAAKGVPTNIMSAVPMGVSDTLLDRAPEQVERGTIVYLGTLIRVRRLNVLVEALRIVRREHRDARLVFVGDGEVPEDRAFLEASVAEQGLEAAVEFTGMLPIEEAHARTAAAAVCVSPFYPTPILRSTSPTKICEYMALGRPVVANEHPEQSRIIAASRSGYCVEWSAEAFAAAICRLLADPEQAEAMGAAGREWVRKHRTYPIIADEVLERYRLLFGQASADG